MAIVSAVCIAVVVNTFLIVMVLLAVLMTQESGTEVVVIKHVGLVLLLITV